MPGQAEAHFVDAVAPTSSLGRFVVSGIELFRVRNKILRVLGIGRATCHFRLFCQYEDAVLSTQRSAWMLTSGHTLKGLIRILKLPLPSGRNNDVGITAEHLIDYDCHRNLQRAPSPHSRRSQQHEQTTSLTTMQASRSRRDIISGLK